MAKKSSASAAEEVVRLAAAMANFIRLGVVAAKDRLFKASCLRWQGNDSQLNRDRIVTPKRCTKNPNVKTWCERLSGKDSAWAERLGGPDLPTKSQR
jgi:hypothetical protein